MDATKAKEAEIKLLRAASESLANHRTELAKSDRPAFAPTEYPAFQEAAFIAGGNIFTVSKLYMDKARVVSALSEHDYLLFFDASGEKLGEARVILRDGSYKLVED